MTFTEYLKQEYDMVIQDFFALDDKKQIEIEGRYIKKEYVEQNQV